MPAGVGYRDMQKGGQKPKLTAGAHEAMMNRVFEAARVKVRRGKGRRRKGQ